MNALRLITDLNQHCPERRKETLVTAVPKVAMSRAVIADLSLGENFGAPPTPDGDDRKCGYSDRRW
jgi:hypothetical protein